MNKEKRYKELRLDGELTDQYGKTIKYYNFDLQTKPRHIVSFLRIGYYFHDDGKLSTIESLRNVKFGDINDKEHFMEIKIPDVIFKCKLKYTYINEDVRDNKNNMIFYWDFKKTGIWMYGKYDDEGIFYTDYYAESMDNLFNQIINDEFSKI